MLLKEDSKKFNSKKFCFYKNLFDRFLNSDSIFINRDLLLSSYIPDFLPHREKEISEVGFTLSLALKGSLPSNIAIYGKPGSGKTASTKIIGSQIESKASEINRKISFVYVNCNTVKSLYSALKTISDEIISNKDEGIVFTGHPIDVVYSKFLSLLDKKHMILIVVLDEVDKLKDDRILYLLSRINTELKNAKLSMVLISNDICFYDSLDERIKSSIGCENIIFPAYDAVELKDILMERAKISLKPGVLDDDVIPYCAANAAQEHGDARRALDLLRVSVDIAERNGSSIVTRKFVEFAKNKIEFDHVVETVRSLPLQSKIVLYSILLAFERKKRDGFYGGVNTGKVYTLYKQLCKKTGLNCLSQRYVSDIIGSLDSMGIINAPVVSRGSYGRSRQIKTSFQRDILKKILIEDKTLEEIAFVKIMNQTKII